jgi:acyl-CoA synthetase (AMP-forming)/AMP-acid ligase II
MRYDPNGNLVYIGRKDSQVKIRGQRVELSEIKHQLQQCMPKAQQTAIKVIRPAGEDTKATLAAFLQLSGEQGHVLPAGKVADNNPTVQIVFLTKVDTQLADRLPSYILPDVYFILPQLPITASSKTDRKQLREIRASFSAQQLADMRASCQRPKRAPSTEAERTMRQL